ncbi:AcrR family transcriptional regulator [Nocardia transvalensis]|uniref:AcrR family transcriptional regulator n=1 Tax=Nocardia transvalensis TaxID=37333 RepID=A0A7W9UGP3_9NOCA|nr:TetR/AcrR family transcriptional regulator [Nocardia transvalensis]MBB5912316.1 AcrR family transcriptional regulator [Nocardia transvalensis]
MLSRRDENAADTRRALVEGAAKLFAANGFENTSTDQIAAAARVTKGAVYHHFANKRALFQAALELVDEQTVAAIAASSRSATTPWEAVVAGLNAFLDRCLDPAYQQICFRDGPTALGFVQWWEHGERHVEGALEAALTALREDGSIITADATALSHVLYGSLSAAALAITRAEDKQTARESMGRILFELLEGRRPDVEKRYVAS